MTTRDRPGFTLFELVLAIALSATLLVLIGTAIHLYLLRTDTSRQRVEEAQLARNILAMIAADLRAAPVFQPQDTSAIAQLIANTAQFDVDSIDQPASESAAGAGGSSSGASAGGSSGTGSETESTELGAESTTELPLGVNGTLEELIVDVDRLPRVDELLSPVATGAAALAQRNAMAGDLPRPSDEKTVRYFVRQGEAIDPSSPAATSLAPEWQRRAGGLVRQEIDRSVRLWAEQSGNQAVLESGQALVAPEVVRIQFRYFGGSEVVESWEMREQRQLPVAVEVSIWLAAPEEAGTPTGTAYRQADLASTTHEYVQTVYLPLWSAANSAAAGASAAGTSDEGTL